SITGDESVVGCHSIKRAQSVNENRHVISAHDKPWSPAGCPFGRSVTQTRTPVVSEVTLETEMPIEIVGQGTADALRHSWKVNLRWGVRSAAGRWNDGPGIQVLIPCKYVPFRVRGIALGERE